MVIIATLLAAIAIVETGDAQHPNGNPAKVGKAGERSEYQISRKVWRQYTRQPFNARNTRDRMFARRVAVNHIDRLRFGIKLFDFTASEKSERNTVEMIASAWNAGPAYCFQRDYDLRRMNRSVRDYAERVANTYEQLRREGK